jgi:hypothetical protein
VIRIYEDESRIELRMKEIFELTQARGATDIDVCRMRRGPISLWKVVWVRDGEADHIATIEKAITLVLSFARRGLCLGSIGRNEGRTGCGSFGYGGACS